MASRWVLRVLKWFGRVFLCAVSDAHDFREYKRWKLAPDGERPRQLYMCTRCATVGVDGAGMRR